MSEREAQASPDPDDDFDLAFCELLHRLFYASFICVFCVKICKIQIIELTLLLSLARQFRHPFPAMSQPPWEANVANEK